MRWPAACLAAMTVAGCGGGSLELSGTLADGEEADTVWHFGGDAGAGVEGDSFTIAGLRGEVIDLRFVEDGDTESRMEIRDWSGGRIHLRDVWLSDGVAYASGVRVEGGGGVTINGIRMSDAERLPEQIDVQGVVLAASRSGDALIVRPLDGGLPDLRVVVTPATEVVSPDGEPVDPGTTEDGDTLRVAGAAEGGYVVAASLTVSRRAALREGDGGRLLGEPARAREPVLLGRPVNERDEGRGEDRDDGPDQDRGERRGRGKRRGGSGG